MPPVIPHPPDLFAPDRKHLVILAHQDDELPYAGLISRMRPEVEIVWVTNGDGTAPMCDEDPEEHAAKRHQETLDAIAHLDIEEERLTFLDHSELTIYELFAHMAAPGAPVPGLFLDIAEEVLEIVLSSGADVVWTLAYQGGHPEHDLTQICATRAVRELAERRGLPVPFYELPAYEFTFLVPLRFKPWRKEPVHRIELLAHEYEAKERMMESYPSQQGLLDDFRRLISLYGKLAWLAGRRPFGFEDYGKCEEFAPVPPDRDLTKSTHISTRLDYMFDSFEGAPIPFDRTLARIAREMLAR